MFSSNLQPKVTSEISLVKSSYIAPFRQVIPWQLKLSALLLGVWYGWIFLAQKLVAVSIFWDMFVADISQISHYFSGISWILVRMGCKIVKSQMCPIWTGVPISLNHRYIEVVQPRSNWKMLESKRTIASRLGVIPLFPLGCSWSL